MKSSLKYKIIPDLKLVIEYFEGHVSLNELIEFQVNQLKDDHCCREFNDLTDIRNASFSVEKNDIRKYAEFVKLNDKMHGSRKIAIVANTPNQTAITMLYTSYTEELSLNHKVFSTVEAALKWLAIPLIEYKRIENTLDLIKDE